MDWDAMKPVPGLLLVILGAIVAGVTLWQGWRKRIERPAHWSLSRYLASFVLFESLNTGFYNGLTFLPASRETALLTFRIAVTASLIALPSYVLFLGHAQNPIADAQILSLLRRPGIRRAILWCIPLLALAGWFHTDWFLYDLREVEWYSWTVTPTLVSRGQYLIALAASLVSLIAIISVLRSREARNNRNDLIFTYAPAFLLFDSYWIIADGFYSSTMIGWGDHWYDLLLILSSPVFDLIFCILLAWGILSTEGYSGPPRRQYTKFKRGVLAFVGLVVFFSVEHKLAEQIGHWGGFVIGLTAVGILGFASHALFDFYIQRYVHHHSNATAEALFVALLERAPSQSDSNGGKLAVLLGITDTRRAEIVAAIDAGNIAHVGRQVSPNRWLWRTRLATWIRRLLRVRPGKNQE